MRFLKFWSWLMGGWSVNAACPLSPDPSPARGEESEEGGDAGAVGRDAGAGA
jgi:hypothetical protein